MGKRARPPGQTEIHTRIPDNLLVRLDRQCERRMVARATIVVRAVEAMVRHLEEQDDLFAPAAPNPVAEQLAETRRRAAGALEAEFYSVPCDQLEARRWAATAEAT